MKSALLALFFAATAGISPEQQTVLNRITPADLRGNLSFLSSDLLEGRDTPSRGLDIAAEFIASEFRRAGLEPITKDSYFQQADYVEITPDLESFELTVSDGEKTTHLTKDVSVRNVAAADLKEASLYQVKSSSGIPDLSGKAAVLSVPSFRGEGSRENLEAYQNHLKAAREKNPAAIFLIPEGSSRQMGSPGGRLLEAASVAKEPAAPTLTIRDQETAKLLEAGKAHITLHLKAATQKPVQLRNVAGLLRGSDPALAETYVLVTAHYDHIGLTSRGKDHINNGANDDGSGTVSVTELANAFSGMKTHPRRSILFMTFFGEEKGLFGSRYYASHPLFPLKQTVAQINLEQLGRTDDNDGPQVATATFTGFHFSDIPTTFEQAGKATGIKVYNSPANGDDFFSRSDNQSLADAGIPAHTLAVAFEFPDYHAPGDEWQKIDYDNMAKVDRMIALGLMEIANRTDPPKWNEKNGKTEKYVEAWRHLHSN